MVAVKVSSQLYGIVAKWIGKVMWRVRQISVP